MSWNCLTHTLVWTFLKNCVFTHYSENNILSYSVHQWIENQILPHLAPRSSPIAGSVTTKIKHVSRFVRQWRLFIVFHWIWDWKFGGLKDWGNGGLGMFSNYSQGSGRILRDPGRSSRRKEMESASHWMMYFKGLVYAFYTVPAVTRVTLMSNHDLCPSYQVVWVNILPIVVSGLSGS